MKHAWKRARSGVLVLALALFGSDVSFALQPVGLAAPAAPAPTTAALTDDAKKAKAKECSAEADAKGLHGQARKDFRSKCKRS